MGDMAGTILIMVGTAVSTRMARFIAINAFTGAITGSIATTGWNRNSGGVRLNFGDARHSANDTSGTATEITVGD